VIDDPALAQERFVGLFQTNEPESFAPPWPRPSGLSSAMMSARSGSLALVFPEHIFPALIMMILNASHSSRRYEQLLLRVHLY
jgi:hypothetical protein